MAGTAAGALHVGFLIIRLGVGMIFVVYGYPILSGGTGKWNQLGNKLVEPLGVSVGDGLWGFLAAAGMTVGGLFVALGLLVRPSAFLLLLVTSLWAYAEMHRLTASLEHYYFPLSMAIVFAGLLIGGGGDYSLGRAVKPLDGKWYQ